jgi:hypothetical protein
MRLRVVYRILLTITLLVLASLKLLKVPQLIKGNLALPFAGVQSVVFVFLLAALSTDVWSRLDYSGNGYLHYGLVGGRQTGHDSLAIYHNAPSGASADEQDFMNTFITAGAFTLIFGLLGQGKEPQR